MGAHGHLHHHRHRHDGEHEARRHRAHMNGRRLVIALVLTSVYLVAEVVGGLYTGSLALLADAGHMASDVASLALALGALWLAQRPPTPQRSFGYQRAEILAALVNATALCVVTVLVLIEAWERLLSPTPVLGGPMLLVASGGLLVNISSAAILRHGKDENLNVRGAFLHVVADALGSVAAMTSALLVWRFGLFWADPAASFAIGALVLLSAVGLLRQAVGVLMQMAPAHVDVDEVARAMREVRGVASVHDLHLWTVTSGREVLSAHVVLDDDERREAALHELQALLGARFGLDHVTLQLEREPTGACRCSFGHAAASP